jgi:ABC-type multidrug transport system fused ATPase/permease subunit
VSNVVIDTLGNRGLRSLIEVTGSVLVITLMNAQLALLSLITVPILSRLTRLVVVKSAGLARQQQVASGEALQLANERLSQIRTVKVFGQEGEELKR